MSARNKKLPRPNRQRKDTRPISVTENTSGFSIIPAELLSEILSYIPRPVVPLSTERWKTLFTDVDAEECLAWRKTLLSLSQTCRHLREFFWPQIWKRIDICEGMYNEQHEQFSKALFEGDMIKERLFNVELARQLEVVTVRDPYLAGYVNVINVEVVEFSIEPVLVELARCLSLFPNLRAVKLKLLRTNKTVKSLTGVVRRVFSKRKYPQIRSVGICDLSYPFLSSCPGARSVSWGSNDSGFDDDVRSRVPFPRWPWVECLELASSSSRDLEDIASAFPNVREFTLLLWDRFNLRFSPQLPALNFMLVLLQLQKMEFFVLQYLDEGVKTMFINMIVVRLLELQKRDGEEKEAVLHWKGNKFAARTTLKETKILPAPRRR